jgi:hypothetical protein
MFAKILPDASKVVRVFPVTVSSDAHSGKDIVSRSAILAGFRHSMASDIASVKLHPSAHYGKLPDDTLFLSQT